MANDILGIPVELLVPFLAVMLYGVVMFAYRRIQKGEKFDANKMLQTLGLGFLATMALYLANGTIPPVEQVIQYIEQYAQTVGDGGIVAIGALVWGIIDQYILKGKLTGTALIAPVASKPTATAASSSVVTSPTSASPSFPAGKCSILGIYGGSASGAEPKAAQTYDINQIPEMFFEVFTLITGKVMFNVKIDGVLLKDSEEFGINLSTMGQKVPVAFWIPQKFRTPGQHIVTITTGHLEGQQSISGPGDSVVVWDGSQDFALTFTGALKE